MDPGAHQAVSLTYLVSSRFRERLSQKQKWITPEEQHLKLTSGLHMHMHTHTLIPKHNKSRAPIDSPTSHGNAWEFWTHSFKRVVWFPVHWSFLLYFFLESLLTSGKPLCWTSEYSWNPGLTSSFLLSVVTAFWVHLVLHQGTWFLCLESGTWEPVWH